MVLFFVDMLPFVFGLIRSKLMFPLFVDMMIANCHYDVKVHGHKVAKRAGKYETFE